MGGLFAYFLSQAGEEVVLVDKNPDRAALVRERGLQVEGISGEHLIKVPSTAEPSEVGPCDLVILAVKAYATEDSLKKIVPLVGDDTVVLTLQNGLGNVEILAGELGPERILGGTTSFGATVLGPGHIRHAGYGETVIGERVPSGGDRLSRIVAFIDGVGLKAKGADNLDSLIWGKVLVNVGINALTAITGLRNGKLVEDESIRQILRMAVEEAVSVVEALGVKVPYEDPVGKVEAVAQATAINISSMLQDCSKGNRTEIDFINGAVVREGEKLGVATPVNSVLTLLVRGYTDMGLGRIAEA